jgi:tetratricopeptide (TPR) repeat protein
LEVHRAIDAPGRTAPLPVLPAYVQRDHDRQLQAIIHQAVGGRSTAAVLVGGSSTGKTRACWEAVKALPRDWRLWHPIDPSRPEAAADALPAVGPRTVIWLNEAQHYLLTPAAELGERVAAGLRELLRDPGRGPVLLLGTIWPEYWATLTIPPSPEQQDDPHAQARALLTDVDIPVPDAFTRPALQALEAAAGADPRLAEAALRAEDGRITQFLAGAPALLERYRNAPPAARALIDAAMDARRLGHGLYLPRSLLEAAVPGYLTDQQWDALRDDWLEQALVYCAAPCRGARGPLSRVRPRPGQPISVWPNFRLADYLEQTSRAMRRTVLAPATLWDALVEYADERDLMRIADEAEGRSLYRHASRIYQRAAQAGDQDALRQAAELLGQTGRIDEAVAWYQRAADAGDHDALRRAAQLLGEAGRIDEAVDWYQRAGNRDAMVETARLLQQAGRTDEAVSRYRRAAKAGDRDALAAMAGLLDRVDRIDEAIDWYWLAAKAGDRDAPFQAARLLERAGRIYQAIDWYHNAPPTPATATPWSRRQGGNVNEKWPHLARQMWPHPVV